MNSATKFATATGLLALTIGTVYTLQHVPLRNTTEPPRPAGKVLRKMSKPEANTVCGYLKDPDGRTVSKDLSDKIAADTDAAMAAGKLPPC